MQNQQSNSIQSNSEQPPNSPVRQEYTRSDPQKMNNFRSERPERTERQERQDPLEFSRTDTRVIQKNLVYVIGIPYKYANPSVLKSEEFFGQFGEIKKLVVK